MGIKRLSLGGLLLLLTVAMPLSVSADTPVDEVARELVCQCGCYMVLNNCTHQECGSRESMTAAIQQQLAQGKSKQQIIGMFVAEFGEQVVSTPPKKGFNLTAWVTPFVAIIAGGLVIWFAIRRWVRLGKDSAPEPLASAGGTPGNDDEKYLVQLEKDLRNFGERGFR